MPYIVFLLLLPRKNKHLWLMTSAFDRTFKLGILLSVIDWLTFNIVFLTAYYLDWFPLLDWEQHFTTYFITANVAYVIALQAITISLHHRQAQPAKVLSNTSRTSLIFTILYTSFLGMFTQTNIPDFWESLFLGTMIFITTSVERLFLRTYIIHLRNSGRDTVKAIILGSGEMAQKAAYIMGDNWNGYHLMGYFARPDSQQLNIRPDGTKLERLGDKNDIMSYIEKNHIDEIYISEVPSGTTGFKSLMQLCDKEMVRMYYMPSTFYGEFRKAKVKEFGDIYVLSQYNEPLLDLRNRMQKRIFDLIVSLLFLCTLFPFILAIVYIVSKITMPGPLFFKQKRTGYDGRDFYCYKFRSMKVNKDSDTVQAVKNDPRVTKWGAFMRHTNIDELPQFINVLKGDMSIVGPRPHMLKHTEEYSKLIDKYMMRHFVKPGITGWSQVTGYRGETKELCQMEGRVKGDIYYIEHWSIWLDIYIIYKTVANAIKGDEEAY